MFIKALHTLLLTIVIICATQQNTDAQIGSVFNNTDIDTSRNLSYGFSMGTGFSSLKSSNSFSSTYYAPYVNFRATKNLFISTTLAYNKMNFNNFSSPAGNKAYNGQMNNTYLSTIAIYKLNSKIDVYGAFSGSLNKNEQQSNNFYSNYNNGQSYSLGFTYHITPHMQFDASFNVLDRPSFYNQNSMPFNFNQRNIFNPW
jgi:hypothetical protein